MQMFADADSSLKDARFVIVGVPFDGTASFRRGACLAPDKVREASWNFESHLYRQGAEMTGMPIHDFGNLTGYENVDGLVDAITGLITEKIRPKFPLLLGGEHSVTIGATRAFEDAQVLVLDAHLDFRDEYLGVRNSHTCVTRRIFERVGAENVSVLGVRSCSAAERRDAERLGLSYIDATSILRERGIENIFNGIELKRKVYLSLDMDVLDPIYAPGVQNPEPFGLSSADIYKCIAILAPRLIGFDIVELTPIYDTGITAVLATAILRTLIASLMPHVDAY